MTVKVRQPSINLREKITELEKPGGVAGRDILKAETPQEVFNYISAGRKNLIINGDFKVWQRGTSITRSGGIQYGADRFWTYNGNAGTFEQSTDAPDGFVYSWFNNTAGAGAVGTTVELPSIGKSDFKKLTFSGYFKGTFGNIIFNYRNSAGNGANEVAITTLNLSTTYTDWTKITFQINATGITPNATNTALHIEFTNVASGARMTGLQLERGDVATPFEYRSYGEELALCQRYYQRGFANGSLGVATTSTLSTFGFRLVTEMRATPSVGFNPGYSYMPCDMTHITGGYNWTPTNYRFKSTSGFCGYGSAASAAGDRGNPIEVKEDALYADAEL